MARPISASPSTDQVATSHLLWLNNQCKKKESKKEKKKKKKLQKKRKKIVSQSFEKAWQAATWFPSRTFRYFKLFYILSLLPMYKKRNKSIEDLVSVAHIQVVVFYLHFQSRQHPSLHYNFCLFIWLLYLLSSLQSIYCSLDDGPERFGSNCVGIKAKKRNVLGFLLHIRILSE